MTKFIKNHFVGLVLLSLFIGFVSYRIYTADPQGYCSSEYRSDVRNQYLSDEYFIKAALRDGYLGNISKLSNQDKSVNKDENIIAKYIEEYPECCHVYRKSEQDIKVYSTLWDRAFWHHQTIAVKIQDIESIEAVRNGKYPVHDDAILFMSICGNFLDGY